MTESVICNGRPSDKRCDVEESTYDFLEKNNIDFVRVDHAETATIEECHKIEDVLGVEICKNLFLQNSAKTKYYLLLLPGEKRFVSKEISKKLSSTRLSFAPDDKLYEFLKIEPGSVSIMGLIHDKANNVNLVIDSSLLEKPYFCCHPCKNTSTLKFSTDDIINKFISATNHQLTIIDI
ncbi:MAG: prolyl-tRNA synthetase associated domain-containing protein [Clostridia bacterium]|nr:prolyl-tRNA synthetase associated domain-containing protein [Clostridia bacterium]